MLSMSTGVFHDVSYAYLLSMQNNWDPVLATHSRTLHNMPYLSVSVVIADDEEVRHSVPIVEVNRLVVVYPLSQMHPGPDSSSVHSGVPYRCNPVPVFQVSGLASQPELNGAVGTAWRATRGGLENGRESVQWLRAAINHTSHGPTLNTSLMALQLVGGPPRPL